MKYIFKHVDDEEGSGEIKQYLEAKSKTNPTNRIKLVIDHDLCAPMETWTLIHYYIAVNNRVPSDSSYNQQVYHGRELTDDQRDMMVELVTEFEYFDYCDFIKND